MIRFYIYRYDRDTIVDGPDDPYRGFDRHNGEIASFHLEGYKTNLCALF